VVNSKFSWCNKVVIFSWKYKSIEEAVGTSDGLESKIFDTGWVSHFRFGLALEKFTLKIPKFSKKISLGI